MNMSRCDENANCTNTDGSYNCSCNHGYNGDGFNCTGNKTIKHNRIGGINIKISIEKYLPETSKCLVD